MKYILYPGCAGEATTKEALKSTTSLLEFLGVDFTENEALSCCGAGIVEEEDPEFEIVLNARNFALAEQEGRDILTICNTCLYTMLRVQKTLREDPKILDQVNTDLATIGLCYKGTVKITHFLWFLRDEIGLEKIKALINKPINQLKIAPFYGCHIIRPTDIMNDEKQPEFMNKLIRICGAEDVEYKDKYNCCGFHILLADQDTSLKMTEECLINARKSKADMLVTPCTLCHINLDGYQKEAMGADATPTPVLHLGQMLGLAMGLNPKALGLNQNLVSVGKLSFDVVSC